MDFRTREAARLHLKLNDTIKKWNITIGCGNAPDLWFTGSDGLKESYVQLREIMAICDACPVKNLCAEYAIEQKEEFGIWGGTTPLQRRILARMKNSGKRKNPSKP